MNKQFTNKQLKNIINNLYNENNIIIDEILQKKLNQSSKTQYKTLKLHYDEIKLKIEILIKSENSSQNNESSPIHDIIINKEIETQTDNIIDDKNEIIELRTEIFKMRQLLSDYKYKILNYKKLIKIKNKKSNEIILSSDDEQIKEKKREINYHRLVELSSVNIINELKLLSKHELKILYNRYFSNKLKRQLIIN